MSISHTPHKLPVSSMGSHCSSPSISVTVSRTNYWKIRNCLYGHVLTIKTETKRTNSCRDKIYTNEPLSLRKKIMSFVHFASSASTRKMDLIFKWIRSNREAMNRQMKMLGRVHNQWVLWMMSHWSCINGTPLIGTKAPIVCSVMGEQSHCYQLWIFCVVLLL